MVRLTVKPTAGGSKLDVDVDLEKTVLELKEELSPQCSIPALEQRLVWRGQVRVAGRRGTPPRCSCAQRLETRSPAGWRRTDAPAPCGRGVAGLCQRWWGFAPTIVR